MRFLRFVLLLLLPASAAAQDFSALRDSLTSTRDTLALRAALAGRIDRADAAGLVRAGLLELRLYELTAERDRARRARSHFDRARDVGPGLAWAHYGWALAMLPEIDRPVGSMDIVTFTTAKEVLGLDARSRARRALEEAVRLDPSLTDAAALLARLADETRDEEATRQARAALEARFARDGDAVAGLGLARAAYAAADFEASAAAARQVAARDSLRAGEAHHAAARALFQLPGRLTDAVAEYYAGVSAWDEVLAHTYYRDIELIITEKEALLWAGTDLPGRRAWIREFWELRAALGGVSGEQRIAEHYRRVADAERYFRRTTRFGAPPRNALRWEPIDDRYDDRGVIYIRHGAPRDVVRTVQLGDDRQLPRGSSVLPRDYRMATYDPEESWVYLDDAGEPVMYNFISYGSEGYDTYLLLYHVPCRRDYLEPRFAFAPELYRVMSCDPGTIRTVSLRLRRAAYEALATDSHRPQFTIPVPFHYDVFTFRGAAGSTDVVTSISVEGRHVNLQQLADGSTEYALAVRVAVVDTAARTSVRRDTVLRVHTAGALVGEQRLRAQLALSVPPTPAAMHRTVLRDALQPVRGQVYGAPLAVPDYAADTLAMSDIVLAAPDSAGPFQRGDVSLSLVPWGAYPGGAFRIFYELYDLTVGGAYSTELRVEREGGGLRRLFRNDTPVRLRFDEVAPEDGQPVQQVRDVRTELPPGEYRLRVRITDQASGKIVERERRLTIPKP